MFNKIARLAKVALEFPEFETEFQSMILKLAEIKPNAKRPRKLHFNIGLIDAKHQVEELAFKYFWILPQNR